MGGVWENSAKQSKSEEKRLELSFICLFNIRTQNW